MCAEECQAFLKATLGKICHGFRVKKIHLMHQVRLMFEGVELISVASAEEPQSVMLFGQFPVSEP